MSLSVVIADGSSKSIDVGYKLVFVDGYLPPGNSNEQLVVSLGSTKPRVSILPQGESSPVVVDVEGPQILEVWVKE